MSLKLRVIVTLWFSLMSYSLVAVIQEPDSLNSVERLENGWMRITGGDPYITFNCAKTPLAGIKAVRVSISGRNVINRHSYTEFFWATDAHGYTEEFKGFFINPYTVKSGGVRPVILNFAEFMQAIEEPGSNLHSLRVDFDRSISYPSFQFRCTMELLSELPDANGEEVAMNLHPPYLSRFLHKSSLLKYTVKHLVGDFFGRVFRDWLFVLLYFFSLSVIVAGTIFAWKKQSSKP